MKKDKLLEEQLRWYDKNHHWRWQEVRDFVLHIVALIKNHSEEKEYHRKIEYEP